MDVDGASDDDPLGRRGSGESLCTARAVKRDGQFVAKAAGG